MMTFVFCSKSGAKGAKSELRHSLFDRDHKGMGRHDKGVNWDDKELVLPVLGSWCWRDICS
jgi:hypothetical protein